MGDDYIEKAGAYLAKFMRDMLDGDEFFKMVKVNKVHRLSS
jgi:hypothetical protein